MLKIEKLTKYYGKTLGVKDINLEVKTGEIFGFIGPNGAGKSTTIKCIMNQINKTEGNIYINGTEVNDKNSILKADIGYLPSEINLYDDLSVLDIFKYSGSFYKKESLNKAKELSKRLELNLKKKIDELSFGNLKKVGIVLALMHQPKLIIMDEATNGLDPLMQEEFYNILKDEQKRGATIFFSSHNLIEIKKICDRVGIIKNGKLIKIDNPKELVGDNVKNITIISKEIKKILKDIDGKIIEKKENQIKMIYKNNINILIKNLSKYKIENLIIEEPSIEEIFMHYYK